MKKINCVPGLFLFLMISFVLGPMLVPGLCQALAVWPNDVAIDTSPGDQGLLSPIVVTDGAGGAIILWQDRSLSMIFMQHLDADGNPLWGPPRPVLITSWDQFLKGAVYDGHGGVIAAWIEGRNGWCGGGFFAECDVYSQRFDGDGVPLWGAGGVPVVVAERNQGVSGVAMTGDGNGGVFLAWEDARLPNCCKVFAQHLGQDGRSLWVEDGLQVSPEPTVVIGPMDSAPQMTGDGEGGAVVAWINNQVNPGLEQPTLNVQRISADGQFLWTEGGVPVGEPSYTHFKITSDTAGGVLLAFTALGTDLFGKASVQRVNASGDVLWGNNGVVLAPDQYYYQEVPDVIADGEGGAIIAWIDHRNIDIEANSNPSDIYAQRVSPGGQVLWSPNGLPICVLPGAQDNPRLITDGAGGAIIVWRDARDYLDPIESNLSANVYAQHISPYGQLQWSTYGAPVTRAAGSQGVAYGTPPVNSIQIITDMAGGAILAWPDGRNGICDNAVWATECDVYSQRINENIAPIPVADLAVIQSAEPNPMPPTGTVTLTYTLTVTNNGPHTAGGVKVMNTIPAETTIGNIASNGLLFGPTLMFDVGILAPNQSVTTWFSVSTLTNSTICNTASVFSDAIDEDPSNNDSTLCVQRGDTHVTGDLAVVELKAPKKIKLKEAGSSVTKHVIVKIQNRGIVNEVIPDCNALAKLVTVQMEGIGTSCAAPSATMVPGRCMITPVTLKPKAKLSVPFEVTFDCANDPLQGQGHEDFRFRALVNLGEVEGRADSHPEDDVCPRPPFPSGFDPNNPSIKDRGCGSRTTNGTLGGDVITDIVVK